MADLLCAYGDCEERIPPKAGFKMTITESFNGTVNDRQSFCCYEHAILWLHSRDERINRGLRKWRPAEEGRP
jgi:hypothetical protein